MRRKKKRAVETKKTRTTRKILKDQEDKDKEDKEDREMMRIKMTVRGTMVRSEVCNSWCFCLES